MGHSVQQRQQLLRIFHILAENPFQTGSSVFHDSSDREIHKQVFDQWIISFWSDHAVKEVRIIGIQRRR